MSTSKALLASLLSLSNGPLLRALYHIYTTPKTLFTMDFTGGDLSQLESHLGDKSYIEGCVPLPSRPPPFSSLSR